MKPSTRLKRTDPRGSPNRSRGSNRRNPPERDGSSIAGDPSERRGLPIVVRRGRPWAGVLVFALAMVWVPAAVAAQVGGNLAQYPPVELEIEVTSTPDGPNLSATEFELVTGEYYRVNITSDGGEDWRFEAPDLLQNSHLRLVTVNQVEVHLQGMSFRAIELDEGGTARFSFTPIRPGTYEFFVGDVPSLVGRPIGASGLPDDARAVVGRFIVR